MKKTDSKVLLSTNWNKVSIKGTSKTKILSDNIYYIDADNNPKIIIDLYNHFIKNDHNDSKSFIMALLMKFGVINVRVKGKTISFELENHSVVKVKLTTNDIVNNSETIIKAIISNYLKTRNFIIKEMLNNKKDITFEINSSDSGIKLSNNVYYLKMINERGIEFGIDDDSTLLNIFNDIISNCSNKIEVLENYVNYPIENLYNEGYEYQKVIIDVIYDIGGRMLNIINPSNSLYEKLKQLVDEHNKSINDLNIDVSKKVIKQ